MSGDDESIWDEQDRLRRVRLLEIVGMSQASEEPLNIEELADEFGVKDGIDDLPARGALLAAGSILIEEFRAAWLDGDPVEHARELAMSDRVSKPNAEWMRNSRGAECGMTPLPPRRRAKPP